MTTPLLTLNAEVLIRWDGRNWDCEAYVDVEYTYDGSELTIKSQYTQDPCLGLSDNQFNELVYEAVSDIADERYAEALEDLGEDA